MRQASDYAMRLMRDILCNNMCPYCDLLHPELPKEELVERGDAYDLGVEHAIESLAFFRDRMQDAPRWTDAQREAVDAALSTVRKRFATPTPKEPTP